MSCTTNVHKYLDNDELHVPKDFSTAGNNEFPTKNNAGSLDWRFRYWDDPILAQTDGSIAPPTNSEGDRYILTGSTAVSSSWDGAYTNQIVEYISGSWEGITPQIGMRVYDRDTSSVLTWTGAAWVADSGGGSTEGVERKLVSYDSVDLTDASTTNIHTGASGNDTFITKIILRAKTFGAVTVAPTINVYVNSTEDVIPSTVLTGFDSSSEDEYYVLRCDAVVNKVQASQNLVFDVSWAATADSMDVIVDVFGYEIST